MKKLTCASFFAGVGGIDLGFEETGRFKTIYANEFDKSAVKTFEANFPNIHVDCRNIANVPPEDIPSADIYLAGFPCQAFSVAGYRKGFDDAKGRGILFFELTRIIKGKVAEGNPPKAIFLENVRNLEKHDNGNTFKIICHELEGLGYKYTYRILNAMNYGDIPQTRERIYIIAFRNLKDIENFKWPEPVQLTKSVKDIIDFKNTVDDKYYYIPGRYKDNIYKAIVNAMSDDNPDNPSIYQYRRKYVRKNKKNVIPTLTACQGEGGHNVSLIKTFDGKIRKMTPRECFNAQGFPSSFILPEDMPDSKLYKQSGNSVCVSVIKRIAENIAEVLA